MSSSTVSTLRCSGRSSETSGATPAISKTRFSWTSALTKPSALHCRLFSAGQVGGWPKRFGEMVKGENKGFAFAPIKVEIAPDLSKWSAEIPAHNVQAAAEALMGPTSEGKVTKIYNLPGAETGPGGVATWGRATADRADAFGFKWDRDRQVQQAHRLSVERSGLKPSRCGLDCKHHVSQS